MERDRGREDGTISYFIRFQGATIFVLSDLQEGFGFGWLFKRGERNQEFAEFRLFLPDAAGRRYSKMLERGADIFLSISANLTVALEMLEHPQYVSRSNRNQLLTVRTATQPGRIGGQCIGGEISPSAREYLLSPELTELPECTDAMLNAVRFMTGHDDLDPRDFPAYLNSEGPVIDCPGDTCGINPAGNPSYGREGKGFHFSCHNVDTPFQQLLLLVGLAALCDRTRQEMAKPLS